MKAEKPGITPIFLSGWILIWEMLLMTMLDQTQTTTWSTLTKQIQTMIFSEALFRL